MAMEPTVGHLSEDFLWEERLWLYLSPEYSRLPVYLFIDEDILNGIIPMIMFYPCKNRKADRRHGIPMVICDNPYIPKEYENIPHELTNDELQQIKDWVVKYKDILLLTYHDGFYVDEELEKAGAYIKQRDSNDYK